MDPVTLPILSAFVAELEKLAALPASSLGDTGGQMVRWGRNLGKNWGLGSTKGGWNTSMKSSGVQSAGVSAKAMTTIPPLPGTKKSSTGLHQPLPPIKSEANNMVNLRRGLSNITTPQPT